MPSAKEFAADAIDVRQPSPIDLLVGGRLKLRRMMLGMTQAELGELCGLSAQQVYKYEQGRSTMGAARLAKAADVLSVSVGWFFDEFDTDASLPNDFIAILSDPLNVQILSIFHKVDDSHLKQLIINILTNILQHKEALTKVVDSKVDPRKSA